jgi:hypothetical protein
MIINRLNACKSMCIITENELLYKDFASLLVYSDISNINSFRSTQLYVYLLSLNSLNVTDY